MYFNVVTLQCNITKQGLSQLTHFVDFCINDIVALLYKLFIFEFMIDLKVSYG